MFDNLGNQRQRGELGSRYEVEQGTETPSGGCTNEMEPRQGTAETRTENRITTNQLDPLKDLRSEKIEPRDINGISGPKYYVIGRRSAPIIQSQIDS
jgi:hypothetical protein